MISNEMHFVFLHQIFLVPDWRTTEHAYYRKGSCSTSDHESKEYFS